MLVLVTATTSLVLGAGVGATAAPPDGPPESVTQDRSVFACSGNPGMAHMPDASRRNVGDRCLEAGVLPRRHRIGIPALPGGE